VSLACARERPGAIRIRIRQVETFMLSLLAPIGSLWLLVALLFKGILDRPFVACLFGSWCFLHLLWILVREPRN